MHKMRKAVADGAVPEFDSPLADKPSLQVAKGGALGSVHVARETSRATDHRNEDRYPLVAQTAKASWRDETHEVQVVNFSSNGLQIETDRNVDIAETIAVKLGDCDPINCAVRWVRDGRVGLEFEAETRILAESGVIRYVVDNIKCVLGASGERIGDRVGVERRSKATRHGMIWIGCISFDNSSCMARLRNISRTGAMLQIDSLFAIKSGHSATLNLGDAGEISGSVVWASGAEIGMHFDEEFDVSLLVDLTAVSAEAVEEAAPEEPKMRTGQDRRPSLAGIWDAPDHIAPVEETGRLTLEEVYATLYPDGRPEPEPELPDALGDDVEPDQLEEWAKTLGENADPSSVEDTEETE